MVKSVYFFGVFFMAFAFASCNKFRSDHPQSELTEQYATSLDPKSIIQYTDSIDKNLSHYKKESSLIYMLGESSFYVDRYTQDDNDILLVEHMFNGLVSSNVKKLYFKNDSLILEKVNSEIGVEEGAVFKENRSYLRNNTVFKNEERTASSKAGLVSESFIQVPLSKIKKNEKTYLEDVSTLNEVVDGLDKFDLVFQNITTYPDSRYIILKSKTPNGYSASILVKEKDVFIDSLLNDPINFKDQKLKFNWVIRDNEAIYVPVSNNTSAKGLNK